MAADLRPVETSLLGEARVAWRQKKMAEATLARLRRYERMTAGMKQEQQFALDRLSKAEATLERVLGAAA